MKIENKNKISQVVKDNLCTGCGTCYAMCPKEAISIEINEKKGIYEPVIDESKCNNCGICMKVCPGHEVDFEQLNSEIFGKEPEDILIGNYLNCYIGYSTDYDIRYNSSSGGLVTQLLIFALEEGIIDGALVTRMKKDKPLEPEPFIARTREEIIEASKSKYCPVPANVALKEILDSKEGEKFAVVGLPCHIHGIRKAEQINKKLKEKIVLHVGIFCGKTISFLGTEFQLKRMGVKKEEVKKLDYRGEGWPGSMTIQLKNKQRKLSELYYYYYDSKFGSFVPWRCTLCNDAACELADISFGDAWLPEVKKGDKEGTSIVVSRNRRGEDILQRMIHKRKVKLSTIISGKVNESQGGFSWKKKDLKARFTISKLIGRKVPIFDNAPPLQPSFRVYLSSVLLYSQRFFASKPRLWWLLDIYYSLLKYGSRIKSWLKL